ncbi:kinase-like domain-containing protein [Parachaetomium inaequale]|uniref:Kinase-like domain-containing protein n=1 Tax=Parachaetomium inaequale TaxID=2588326 RepID=A0AAN6SPC3_9PEZI|nr:kinase-like domain-containing protein [Parachaetomium inaequale]
MTTHVLLKAGEVLKSKTAAYTIGKQLQGTTVILKSVRHWRLQNERDILLRYQSKTSYMRPFLDEIDEPPALVLKHLDDDLLQASNAKTLTRHEFKFVARRVLEALDMLHQDGFVHTDIKPSNVLVNYGKDESNRFADIQLCDFESTVKDDCKYALEGTPIGTSIFRSPEAQLEMRWGTSTDIWSFGAMLISLIYGEDFHIFNPRVPGDHEDFEIEILFKHHRCFGPFPTSYIEIADDARLAALTWIINNSPAETLRPFHMTTEREICREDRDFVCKIKKLDPRDRPTARELLEHPWFGETTSDGEETSGRETEKDLM